MTDLNHQRPLSRVELIVLGRLTMTRGATAAELAQVLRDAGMPLADADLPQRVSVTLRSLGDRALIAGPAEPRKAAKPSAKAKNAMASPPEPRFKATEMGRVALRDAFGVKTTPTWREINSRIVPALALGEVPGSDAATRALSSAKTMIASLLRGDLPLGEIAAVSQLCDRIIARALGMPLGPVTPDGIRAYALAMHCGEGNKTELERIAVTFAPTTRRKGQKLPTLGAELNRLADRLADKRHVDTESKATIVRSLRQRWVSEQDAADDSRRPSALRAAPLQPPRVGTNGGLSSGPQPTEALLQAVQEAIPMVGSKGRYGKRNVFVSALWQQVARDRRLPSLSLDGFKRWLVAANRNQLVALARADLVDAMDARMVEDSEIEDLGATFHFVLDRRDSYSAAGTVHDGR